MNTNTSLSTSPRLKRTHSQITMSLRSSSNPSSSSTSLMNGGSSGEGSTIGSRGSSAPPLRTSLLDEGNEGAAEDDGIRMGELELMGEEEQEDRPQKVRRMNGSGQGEGEGEGEGNGNDIGNIIDFRHSNGDETEHEGDGMDFNDSTTPSDDSDPQTGREITEQFGSLPIEFDVDMVSKIDGYMEKKDAMNVDDKPDDGHESIETPIEGREPLHAELANELTCGMCAGLFVEPLTLTPCGHAFCGSCIVLWLKSFQLNHLLTYTNPTPALQHQLALAREREMYGDSSPANGVTAIANGAIDGTSMNRILGGGLGGVHATPIEGLSCPQCRLRPVVDAAPSMVLKSLIDVLTKHHPDMARTTDEIAQMQTTYKRGDLLSFPQPPKALAAGGAAAVRSRERLTGVSYWGPCPFCRPLREGEVSTENGGSRYVCPLPIPDPNNPAQVDRALRSDGMIPDGHRMCSVCQQICPEALAQSCGICGDGCCGLRTRCQLPKLEDMVLSDSSFQVLDTMRGWIKDEAWNAWQDYLSVFQYNFVELSYFLAYVQAEYVKTHMASTAMATLRPPVVDVGISVELGGGVVLEAAPPLTLAVTENPVPPERPAVETASVGIPIADEQHPQPSVTEIPADQVLDESVASQAPANQSTHIELTPLGNPVEQPVGNPTVGEESGVDRATGQQGLAADVSAGEQPSVEHNDLEIAWEQFADPQPVNFVPAARPPVVVAPLSQEHPAIQSTVSATAAKQAISTAYICQSIAQWLMSDEGFSSGGLNGMCKRADKEGLVRADAVPEKLCTGCADSVFCAGMFEWWMREAKRESVRDMLPTSIRDREPCKNGRACPYQSNMEHAKIYSHLSEKLAPELMESMAHQSPPVVTEHEEDDFVILSNAVKDARELFGLPRDPPALLQQLQPLPTSNDIRQEDVNSELNDQDDGDDEDDEDDEDDDEEHEDADERNEFQQSITYTNVAVQTDVAPPLPILNVEVALDGLTAAVAGQVQIPDIGRQSDLSVSAAPLSPVLNPIKNFHFDGHGNGNGRAVTPISDNLTAVVA